MFAGAIPSSFALLSNIEYLYLSNNKLNGTIDPDWGLYVCYFIGFT